MTFGELSEPSSKSGLTDQFTGDTYAKRSSVSRDVTGDRRRVCVHDDLVRDIAHGEEAATDVNTYSRPATLPGLFGELMFAPFF